jgi:hypothetical protein
VTSLVWAKTALLAIRAAAASQRGRQGVSFIEVVSEEVKMRGSYAALIVN